MTSDRDSSGGYLTGNESERLWDAEEEDDFIAAYGDGDDTGEDIDEEDKDDGGDGPIELVWTRAFAVASLIVANRQSIGRVRGLTTFDPDDETIEELEARSDALAGERLFLESEMRKRGFPPRGWLPPAAPPLSVAAVSDDRRKGWSLPPNETLRPRLMPAEYQHWEWLIAGVIQNEVARRLGISQAAVSKREKKLRAKVDVIFVELTGRPYHWALIPKPQGGRRRKS